MNIVLFPHSRRNMLSRPWNSELGDVLPRSRTICPLTVVFIFSVPASEVKSLSASIGVAFARHADLCASFRTTASRNCTLKGSISTKPDTVTASPVLGSGKPPAGQTVTSWCLDFVRMKNRLCVAATTVPSSRCLCVDRLCDSIGAEKGLPCGLRTDISSRLETLILKPRLFRHPVNGTTSPDTSTSASIRLAVAEASKNELFAETVTGLLSVRRIIHTKSGSRSSWTMD